MKYIIIIIAILGCSLSFAADKGKDKSTVKSFDDYVEIRYMPSKGDFHRSEPITELKSKSHTIIVLKSEKVMSTNESIKKIYNRAKLLKDKGITSNQQYFHVSTKKVEVSYMGEVVSLEYAGKSNSEKYSKYENEWLELYNSIYQYLTKDIIP